MAQAMVVPAVAVPAMATAAVPTIATLTAAAATAKAAPAAPRTAEQRGKILRFTDLSYQAKRVAPAPPTRRRRKKTAVVEDDILEADDEVEDDSDEDADDAVEEDDDTAIDRPAIRSRAVLPAPADSDDDYAVHSDSDEDDDSHPVRDARETDARDAGDGHFAPTPRHVPAEHLEWEDRIAWGSESEDEDEGAAATASKAPPAARDPAPAKAQAPELKREETKPPAAEAAAATENDAPKPKKMVVRFGCKPAKKPAGEGAAGGGGGGGGGSIGGGSIAGSHATPGASSRAGVGGPAAIGAISTGGGGGGGGGGGAGSAAGAPPPPPRQSPSARDSGGARIPTPPSRLIPCPSRVTRSSRGYGLTPLGRPPPRDTSKAASAGGVGGGCATTTPRRPARVRASYSARAFSVPAWTWTSPSSRRSPARARRCSSDGIITSPEALGWTRSRGRPRMRRRRGASDRPPCASIPTIRTWCSGRTFTSPTPGEENQGANGARSLPHPWNAALASTRPGRKIAAVEDLDAFLNISLDGDDEETGADGRRADREGGKKDKGLVGRPGRMESVYNAAVVGGSPTFLPSSHVKSFPKPPPMFAPPPYAHRHKMGLALGFKAAGGDDKFQVAVKSLTTDSETVKISARPGDTVETLLRRVRKKWTDLRGRLEAYFPEGEHGKAYVAACEAAKAEGRDPPRAAPLDERATLEQCGVKRRVPEPLVYVVAPECFLLDESVVSEQRPAAVAAAQAALARAMGEENPEAEAAAGANTGKTAEELAAAAAAVTAADPAEAVANAITKPSDLSATNGRIILVQYAECNPPLIAKPGMGAKRVTYYRRRTQGDTSGRSLTQGGTKAVVDLRPEASSPFISDLPPGQPQEALETTLFRAPLFSRRINPDEGMFLLIRSPHGGFTMREVTEYFVVGQEEPHVEVFQPNTDRCRDFEERAINAAVIFSLLKQREEKVPEEEMRIKVSDIERQFNRAIEDKDIRRRIRRKVVLPVRPPVSVDAPETSTTTTPTSSSSTPPTASRTISCSTACAPWRTSWRTSPCARQRRDWRLVETGTAWRAFVG